MQKNLKTKKYGKIILPFLLKQIKNQFHCKFTKINTLFKFQEKNQIHSLTFLVRGHSTFRHAISPPPFFFNI